MCDAAANITDRVFPNAPIRQWVLSLPFELRGLAATKPDVLTAIGRIFAEEIARATRRLANLAGAETGAVSFPQRLGGSLNLHVHFHTLAVDGAFEKYGGGVRLHEVGRRRNKRYGDGSDQAALSVAVDSVGDILVAGDFLGNIDFGSAAAAHDVASSPPFFGAV